MARRISKRAARKAFKNNVANIKSRNRASKSMTRRGGIGLTVN